ncbi:MAG: AMP-binding protein [Actinomycetota bacterium]|nr:AMP-binding protein [Actinomycetota bacterium]
MYMRRVWVGWRLLRSLAMFMADERRRGTLKENLRSIADARGLSLTRDMSHAELLEEKAERLRDRPFLYFKAQVISYRDMNLNANRAANFLRESGGCPGKGLAIIMKNSPLWLYVFFGLEKLGMYTVPVNVALRGDQLAHVIDNSDASFVVIDHDLLPFYQAVAERLDKIEKVIVNTEGAPASFELPGGMEELSRAFGPGSDASTPPERYDPDDLCVLMYTSGTTGLPKGVVYRYNNTNVKAISIVGRLLTNRSDIAYTCYPLFHANALFLTVTPAMHCDGSVALGERFSASRFWDEVRRYGATTFNGLGAVMPILMKQPARPDDADNRVRFVLSAGCPVDMWEDFERRFGVKIYEGYGAVDGGGVLIVNFETAPVGSMGKPLGAKIRVIDGDGNDVPPHTPGQLICYVGERKGSVEYYKNEEATSDKMRDGWLYTGDLVYRDEKGYVYFVGRNTESMRVKGENVSAYEVEQAVLKHPDVLECAVYAVPSELAEDEIMVTLVPVDGKSIDPASMPGFLSGELAKFAVPRYYRVIDALPKTETHRVIKKEVEKLGVTPDTYDREGRR